MTPAEQKAAREIVPPPETSPSHEWDSDCECPTCDERGGWLRKALDALKERDAIFRMILRRHRVLSDVVSDDDLERDALGTNANIIKQIRALGVKE